MHHGSAHTTLGPRGQTGAAIGEEVSGLVPCHGRREALFPRAYRSAAKRIRHTCKAMTRPSFIPVTPTCVAWRPLSDMAAAAKWCDSRCDASAMWRSIPAWSTPVKVDMTISTRRDLGVQCHHIDTRHGVQRIPIAAMVACIQGPSSWLDAPHRWRRIEMLAIAINSLGRGRRRSMFRVVAGCTFIALGSRIPVTAACVELQVGLGREVLAL